MTTHDRSFLKTAHATQPYAELKAYLAGPLDREATLGATWPLVIEPIDDLHEFSARKLGGLSPLKRCGDDLREEDVKPFARHNPFSAICNQFRSIASQLCDYVEPPEFPRDLFWCRLPVEAGKTQFIRWHTDGDIFSASDGKEKCFDQHNTLRVLTSGADFRPAHIYLQATTHLPSQFASNIRAPLSTKAMKRVRMDNCDFAYIFNDPEMNGWVEKNATLTQGPVGHVIAFPSGVPHTGVEAEKPTNRTLIVAKLNVKPRLAGRHI